MTAFEPRFSETYFDRAYQAAHEGEVVSRLTTIFLLAMEALSSLCKGVEDLIDGTIGSLIICLTGDPYGAYSHGKTALYECAFKAKRVFMTLVAALLSVCAPTQLTEQLIPLYTQESTSSTRSSSPLSFSSSSSPSTPLPPEMESHLEEARSAIGNFGKSMAGWSVIGSDIPTAVEQRLDEVTDAFALLEEDCLILQRENHDVKEKQVALLTQLRRQLKELKFLSARAQQGHTISDDLNLQIGILEARISLLLDTELQVGDGYSGAVIITGLDGEPIGVFKPADMDVYTFANPSRLQQAKTAVLEAIRLTRGVRNEIKETIGGKGYLAEVVAYKFANLISPGLVPPTGIATLPISGEERVGSFQLFVKEKVDLKEYFHFKDKIYTPSDRTPFETEQIDMINVQSFEMVSLLHFLMGNFDCHAENIFVKDGRLIAIDAGWSLSPEHPGRILAVQKIQELFGFKFMQFSEKLAHGEQPFSQETCEQIFALDLSVLESIVKDVYPQDEMVEKRIECMRERLTILNHFAEKQFPMKLLAKLNTEERVKAFLEAPERSTFASFEQPVVDISLENILDKIEALTT